MPAQERIGLEDEEGFLPSLDPAGEEEDKPEAIGWCEAWLVNLAVEDDELLAEEGVLGNELGIAASAIEGRAEKDCIARRPGELEGSTCSSDNNAERMGRINRSTRVSSVGWVLTLPPHDPLAWFGLR
jgi:hypothetical protein